MIGAVLFDLDETLFDRIGSLRDFLADQHRRHERLQTAERSRFVERFLELDNRGIVAKSVVYPRLLRDLGITEPALPTVLLAEYEGDFHRHARPFTGLEPLTIGLAERGLPVGIVTNGRTNGQTRTLSALKLDQTMQTCLISESEGVRKPDPAIFHRAAERLGVKSPDCVFVGDNPNADILGARRVGMKTIWFPNGAAWPSGRSDRPDAEVSSLVQILDVLDTLMSSIE